MCAWKGGCGGWGEREGAMEGDLHLSIHNSLSFFLDANGRHAWAVG